MSTMDGFDVASARRRRGGAAASASAVAAAEPGGQRRREHAEVDQVPAQVAALDEFHRERDLAALVEDLADPDVGRVDERGQHRAFPLQPVQDVPVPAEAGIQDLHRKQTRRVARWVARHTVPFGPRPMSSISSYGFASGCTYPPILTAPSGRWVPAGECRHNTSGSERPYSSTRRYRSQEPGDVNQQFRR
jgi:hypothetical protein